MVAGIRMANLAFALRALEPEAFLGETGVLSFLRHGLGVDPGGHVVVALVAQDADDLGRERLVQDLDDGLAVRAIVLGDRALLDVPARPLPQLP